MEIPSSETLAMIFGVLWSASELLAQNKTIKANSVFQLTQSVLKTLSGNEDKKS
jgi:hypothetical protein